ncbi:ImmA/IrrE family metallo-endopeptidase [Thermovorax subterraneus]|nr:ImmA/IrrE family metallo-endopeptidase [Thermovorax subterraneus]
MQSFEQIKKTVLYFIRKCNTRNPFVIADYNDIVVVQRPLGNIYRFYKYIKRNKVIFINKSLSSTQKNVICAHELGHAILHRKLNCTFLRNYTLYSINRFEIEANKFAAELIIDEEEIHKDMDIF